MYGNVTFRSLALDSWTLTFDAGTVRQRGQIPIHCQSLESTSVLNVTTIVTNYIMHLGR